MTTRTPAPSSPGTTPRSQPNRKRPNRKRPDLTWIVLPTLALWGMIGVGSWGFYQTLPGAFHHAVHRDVHLAEARMKRALHVRMAHAERKPVGHALHEHPFAPEDFGFDATSA
ncbi:hypothetical protein MTR62_04365 [Novosphingobium sp. 1949]|uniref:Uncharacterized protein n=1 Tax=Novosphingobium organovorum TaxID=2930092 RepID=A0ABT0BAR7_9SPHN|nr:hypothetical protein [Novosphingobium organovorum]MCJ2181938.1 hypothetical protein [Novosphingobium organovorum]